MLTYRVEFSAAARKDLKKLDKHTAAMILGWVRKNLDGRNDPRQHCKGLAANRSGRWRYCVGTHRLLADIQEDRVVILLPRVGHRRAVYDL